MGYMHIQTHAYMDAWVCIWMYVDAWVCMCYVCRCMGMEENTLSGLASKERSINMTNTAGVLPPRVGDDHDEDV
jgi:hypothetical protein